MHVGGSKNAKRIQGPLINRKPNLRYDHVFAIVRVEHFNEPSKYVPEWAVTIQKVVWSQDTAESEVARLNDVNRDKDCHYFWQVTRIERKQRDKQEK